MLQKIRKSIYSKILALYFAFNLLLPVAFFEVKAGPTTAGNTQFAPVSFGNLVDPFTGDFHYSIPLMEVPGPGGSYPIVLGYSSSSVNQEADAGWVGLGWNLNIGSITRETKGLPDDFKGDEITKTYHLKRSDHVTLDLGSDVLVLKELFGFKLLGLSGGIHFQLYNDSYTGFGMSFGLSASSGINLFAKTPFLKQTIGGSVGFNFDTQKGYSFSSGYGLNSSFYTIGKQKSLEVNSGSINNTLTGSFLGLTSFSKSLNKANYIPGETLPLAYTGANLSAQVGVSEAGTYNSLNIGIGQMTQDLSTSSETFEGAGYLYLNYAQGKEKCLMDYTRENDMPVNEESKTLANPILQADEYYVSGNDLNISFRPYRNDVGYLKPETRDNSYNLSGAGGEVGVDVVPANTDYKIGVDMTTTTGSLYTGPWQNNNFIDHLTFKNDEPQSSGSSANAHLEEHVYFKSTNDLTRSNTAFNTATGGYNASHFHLSLSLKQPKVANVNYETGLGTAQFASERVNRETYIQHWKVNEVETHEFTDGAFKIWTTAPAWDGDLDDFGAGNTFAYPSHALDHHIGKYKITTSDGMEYDYGLPVYNTKYYEVFYTTSTNGADPYVNTPKVGYNSTEASIANTSGLDHFYTKNSLGPHTTNHLLTGIRGHDYVDLKHDGITDDDLGYFMKFNYTRYYTNFKWRTPFYHSYYKKGKYTDEADNKATYVYGEKEVFYINSVESKTHIAVFILSDRTDGCEPAAEGNINPASSGGASSNKLKKLDKIILFNKSDDSKPLQTVEFTYDYSLYTGAESNSSATGRLTLTKVQVTFLDNNKGTTTPYEFEYNSTGSYSALAIDRWGVPATTDAIANMDWDNTENMFQVQGDYDKDGDVDATDASTLATNVSKGLLKKITLPSKGEMNIYYESDDYGYVQQYQAEQLVRIVGTSATNTETYSTSAPIMKGDLRIYFLLPEKIVDVGSDGNNDDGENANVLSYINGLSQVYFKTFQRLRVQEGTASVRYDYVNGYADVETAANTYGVDPTSEAVIDGTQYFTRGYITVKKETYNNAGFDVHPFRKAGWQYLRTERFDLELIEPAETLIGEALTSKLKFFLDIVGDIPDFIGYYNACATKGYCSKIELSNGSGFDAKPSFLRLKVTDYKKTGGGHRVNKITWSDNFAEGPQTLGKIYEYVTVDGKSSGVATSEPMEGKEDNTLSFPRYYLADPNSIYKHDQNFVEGPVNEAYFPVPSVGYSRVVVKNIPYTENIPGTGTPDDVTHNNNGIDVYEFYTAKDFPVYSTSTNISHAGYNDFTIKIPKGYDAYQYNGYSQGFYCELNDMHGKPRSEATYKTGADLSSLATAPIHKREYKYFTNSNGTLLNTVPCLTADGITENVLMGEDYEYFIEQKEHQSSITTIGKAANTDGLLGLPIPTLFPIENSESDIFRSTATNKIVHRKGILKEIVENNEGEITRTTNLYFDALTGDALLTKVNNSFNKPVYNYNYAGHWYYNGMKPASDNTGALIYMADASSGNISLTNAWQYVYEGDQLMITANGSGNFPNGTLLYVNNVDQNDFDVEDVDGIAPATLADVTLKVMKSAHSNLQSVACGNIESLQDPVANNSNVFVMFNKLVSGVVNDDNYSMPNVLTCASGEGDNYYRTASINVTSTYLEILSAGEGECEIQINFPATLGRSPLLKEFKFLSFSVESGVMQVQDLVTGDVMTCTLSGPYAASWAICWKPCFTVLNAGAAEFHNNSWSYDYDDVGDPVMKKRTVNGGTTHTVSTTGSDFHYGKKGIYRVKKNYAYQVARQQSYTSLGDAKTKIGIDGEFDEFTPFDWVTGGNSHWTWAQEMTRVSPYGTTLETTDRSGIYAATLVGYDNKTVTAQAANSSYFETAFDAFEDHGGTYGFRGHFELKLDDNSAQTISTTQAHTGTTSAVLSATKKSVHNFTGVAGGSLPTGNYFRAVENKKYLASGWFHLSDHTHVPNIKVKDVTTGTYITPFVTYNDYPAIENWKKMEIGFEITDDTHQYRIEYYIMNSTNTTQQSGYLDDIRVQPFESAMVSMVYDPLTLWKIAELDNQNFATFYNYDEEGNVVQVKKETVNGVVTIGTSRSSLNRQ